MGKHKPRPVLTIVDLFAGLGATSDKGGWSHAARTRGHNVVTSDLLPEFGCTVTGDLMDPEVRAAIVEATYQYGRPHAVLASPPCECFSVASIGCHWTGGARAYIPKTQRAVDAMELALVTRRFITDDLYPSHGWVMENPTGVLRKTEVMAGLEIRQITMCQFGMAYMKPTDLFSDHFPSNLILPPRCHNGDPCHEAARRGARTGVQGIGTAAERALIPAAMSLRFILALEHLVADELWEG